MARTLVGLKVRLLVGSIRAGGFPRFQTIGSFLLAGTFGALATLVIAVVARGATAGSGGYIDDLLVVGFPAVVLAMVLFASAAGVDSTIDSRKLASEPVARHQLAFGLLAAAAVGPAGLLAAFAGAGVAYGWMRPAFVPAVVVIAAVLLMLATLLLVTRSAANLLGAVANTQLVHVAQTLATLAALLGWLATQMVTRDRSGWSDQRWESLAGVARFTPPGQLALAVTTADRPGAAVLHLLLGAAWLPLLFWVCSWSTEQLALSSPRPGGESRRRRSRLGQGTLLDRITPQSPAGAMARRTVVTRLRSPREAVNTFTAVMLGGGAFLLGPILGDSVDARIVIVSGMVHFAVLFDGNNSFGYDGAPISMEVEAGVDGRTLARGKVIASLVVMTPAALCLPLVLAAMTGGWQWVPAGWLVALGSLIGAAGVAAASAALAPVAMPEGPNPLAAGSAGQGCVAGLMLGACMLVLALASLPVAALVYFASSSSVLLGTAASAGAVVVGALVLWLALLIAQLRLDGHEVELVDRVTLGR